MEENQKQEEEERQGMLIEKTMPIQVEESKKMTTEEEGEQIQDNELSEQIDQLIKVKNMELGQDQQGQDTNLMLRVLEVTSQSPPAPVLELVLSKQGEVFLLDDDLVMDVYNLSFDGLQKNIVQAQRNNVSYDHTSFAFVKERVIVSDVRKNSVTMVDATLAYVGATHSNVKFMLAKNEQMAEKLQVDRKELEQSREQSVGSTMVEMRKAILVEVSTLETTMQNFYDGFVTVHKVVFHVQRLQQWSKNLIQTLRGIHASIPHVKEWITQYKRAPFYLPKMMKPHVELDK